MKVFSLAGTRRLLLLTTLSTADGESFSGQLMMSTTPPPSLPGYCLEVSDRAAPATGEIKSPDDKEYIDRLRADCPPGSTVVVTLAGKSFTVRVKSWA